MKDLLKTALCLLLCSLLSLPALAEVGEEMEERTCGDYTYILLEDGGARITDYDGEDAELTVPDELDGHAVREIGEEAFIGRDNLTSVTLPECLTSIGVNPFSRCPSLAKFDVSPDHPVFAQIDGVLYEKATKALICYPAGKADDSFAVPDGILAIGEGAFYSCKSLTAITLPEGLTTIGNGAFFECDSLTSVTLPDSLTSIGEGTFVDCAALTAITLPDGLTSIGSGAFAFCDSLTSVTLPDGLTSIGDSAFFFCSLTTITLPDSLNSIGEGAFSGCYALTSVTLPDSLTSIGGNPFSSCPSLEKFDVSSDHPVFAQIDGVLYEKATKTLVCYPAGKAGNTFAVPEGILAIDDYAFSGCAALTTITLPEGLASIGDCAFDYCSSLISVTLPDSLSYIGDSAFYCCESLTSVTLPDSLTFIGEGAFEDCPDDLTLIVSRDSYACQYAIDNGLTYTYPDANDWLYA